MVNTRNPKINYETVDQGIIKLRDHKQLAVDLVLERGEPLGDLLKRIYEAKEPDDARDDLGMPKVESASNKVRRIANSFRGHGTAYLQSRMSRPFFRAFGDLMSENFEYLANGHTARYVAGLIESLEKNGYKFEKIVDIGCGPGTVSRTMKRPMTCLDASDYMLELAKKSCEDLGLDNSYVQALAQKTGLPDNEFDLAVASYMLHYQAQGDRNGREKREIDDAMKETSRILRPEGLWLITLPSGIEERSIPEMSEELEYYGFCVKMAEFFKSRAAVDVYNSPVAPRFSGSYIIAAQKKVEAPQEYPPLKRLIYAGKDEAFAFGGTRTKKNKKRKLQPKEKVIEFSPDPDAAARNFLE